MFCIDIEFILPWFLVWFHFELIIVLNYSNFEHVQGPENIYLGQPRISAKAYHEG